MQLILSISALGSMSGPEMTKWSLMRRRVRVVIGGDYAV
jgi:hypothetical protein